MQQKPDGLGFGRPGALKATGFMRINIQKCQAFAEKDHVESDPSFMICLMCSSLVHGYQLVLPRCYCPHPQL